MARYSPQQISFLLDKATNLKPAKRGGPAAQSWHRQFKRVSAEERTDAKTGRVAASKDELKRLKHLRALEGAGLLRDLRWQVRYPLEHPTLGPLKIRGKAGARRAFYTADFTYEEKIPNGWRLVIEERKSGFDDPTSRLRRAVFEWLYRCEVRMTGKRR